MGTPASGPPTGWAAWREGWSRPAFRWDLALTVVLFVTATAVQAACVTWVEGRPGAVLQDPFLALFPPRDLSVVTFGVIYAAIVLGMGNAARYPARLLRVLQAYAYVALLRAVFMYLTPLDPLPPVLPLRDPVVELVSDGQTLTRDLFFSGHTATLYLLYLAQPAGRLRGLLLTGTVAVGALVLAQHAHYTIDVLVAPFVAYGGLRLAGLGRTPWGDRPSGLRDSTQ